MTDQINETEYALELLRRSFPGRSDSQLMPFGMVYCGTRWGRDFRFHKVPVMDGHPLLACNSQKEADLYFTWLAEHLFQLTAEPNARQNQLCLLIQNMRPQDGALLLGMHAAFYLLETESMELHLQQGHSFTQYFNEIKALANPEEQAELDEKRERQRYAQVEEEMMEWLELAPTVGHIDVPWRVPLAVTIKKEQGREQQIDLLNIFYSAFFRYLEEEKQ